jgi:hypothetical protein
MTFISMRSALALALALSVASCGGGKAAFTVGGTAANLKYSGLVLTTNGMETTVVPPAKAGDNASFSFSRQIEYGEVYNVEVKTNPLHQRCGPADPQNPHALSDTAGRLASINVIIACLDNDFAVGGPVSGLTVDGLVLANGSTAATLTVPKGATTFVMPQGVVYNVTYGITVLTQPTGLVCSVANPAGTMGDANVENIAVTCVPASPAP